jgi:hypothetical protein
MDSTVPSHPSEKPINDGVVNLDQAFEKSPDYIKIMGDEGSLQAMNRNGQSAMEIDAFAAVNRHLWPNLWPKDARAKVTAAVASAMRGESSHFDAYCPSAKGAPS